MWKTMRKTSGKQLERTQVLYYFFKRYIIETLGVMIYDVERDILGFKKSFKRL